MKAFIVFVLVLLVATNLLVVVANDVPQTDAHKAKTSTATDTAELSKTDELTNSMLSKRFDEGNVVMQLVKSITELSSNIFKSGFDASVRSLFKKPLTSAVYAVSMLIGVVAMLAFYESPVSPLPVPPLPEPPVGRFPPEYPIYPPPGQQAPTPAFNPKGNGPANYASAAASQQYYHYVPHPTAMVNGMVNPMVNGMVNPMANNNHKRSDSGRLHESSGRSKFAPTFNETTYNNYISRLTSSITNTGSGAGFESTNNNNNNNNKLAEFNKRVAIEYFKQHQGIKPATANRTST